MKIGTENKKAVYALAILGVGAAISLYINVFSDAAPSAPPKSGAVTERESAAAEALGSAATPVPGQVSSSLSATAPRQLSSSSRSRGDEFHPSLRSKRKEDQIDPLTVDPTL